MSGFRCECGAVIKETSDSLCYKGRLISDVEYFELGDHVKAPIRQWLERHTNGIDDVDGAVQMLAFTVVQRHLQRIFRDVFVCVECGRLMIEPTGNRNEEFVVFAPSENPVSAATFGILAPPRGRHVHAFWRDGRGSIRWEKYPWDKSTESIPGWKEFNQWTDLEKAYYELVDRLNVLKIPLSSTILVNEDKVIHRFEEKSDIKS